MRLRILLALEERARSPVELSRDLGLNYDQVNNHTRKLAEAGLIELETIDPRTLGKTYRSCYTGWQLIVDAVARVIAPS
jgi:DNA-binding transcriptional ArsR family regulator